MIITQLTAASESFLISLELQILAKPSCNTHVRQAVSFAKVLPFWSLAITVLVWQSFMVNDFLP